MAEFKKFRPATKLSEEVGGINLFWSKRQEGKLFWASQVTDENGNFTKVGAVSDKVTAMVKDGTFDASKCEACDVHYVDKEGNPQVVTVIKTAAAARAVASF